MDFVIPVFYQVDSFFSIWIFVQSFTIRIRFILSHRTIQVERKSKTGTQTLTCNAKKRMIVICKHISFILFSEDLQLRTKGGVLTNVFYNYSVSKLKQHNRQSFSLPNQTLEEKNNCYRVSSETNTFRRIWLSEKMIFVAKLETWKRIWQSYLLLTRKTFIFVHFISLEIFLLKPYVENILLCGKYR